MELGGRAVALYGRFLPGQRERLQREIVAAGGTAARDITDRSDLLVVGGLATALIDSGALVTRVLAARLRHLPVIGERAFAAALAGEVPAKATLPLSTALSNLAFTRRDVDVLAAFDLIRLERDNCRFADAEVIRSAARLVGAGRSLGETVRILTRVRDLAPRGRHKIVLTTAGEAALEWDDGLTSLEGQGLLPFDEAHATLDDLFEAAAFAEAGGDLDEAARLYDLCARADRSDAIALYNLGNIRLAQHEYDQAALAYQRALARDGRLVEARYNLAQALEAGGKLDAAAVELERVVEAVPDNADAVFNLAQIRMERGDLASAKSL
ncbi:MAG TPA: tetratricopeptide repeat protein, partial [Phenylobacterium sp.]|nr:tetratricopeptide repeat protein [Phenylobacterium sp.]